MGDGSLLGVLAGLHPVCHRFDSGIGPLSFGTCIVFWSNGMTPRSERGNGGSIPSDTTELTLNMALSSSGKDTALSRR